MADFDINRIFEEDYPGLKVAALIGSASDYQKIIEEYLPLIRDQMTVRFRARMKRDYPDLKEDDLRDEFEGHEWTVDGLLVGLLSGSVIVAAWAAFEQSVIVICNYMQQKENVPLAMGDLREQDLCRKLHQYLQTLTRQEFRLPYPLSDIQELRNLYAHHSGSIEQLPDKKKARMEAIIRSNSGVSLYDKHYVVLSPNFVRDIVQKIDTCLTTLLRFVETRYPHDDQHNA